MSNETNNNLPYEHAEAPPKHNVSSSDGVHDVHSGESHGQVDSGENDLSEERIGDSRVLEELSSVREEEIDSGNLLSDLNNASNHSSEKNSMVAKRTRNDLA